jgi:hypothetical protein
MSQTRSSGWSYQIELNGHPNIILKRAIAAEMNYFNTLLNGVAGPLRTIPETFREMTGRYENLFGEVAALGSHPRNFKTLPPSLAPYADLIKNLDVRKSLLLDLAASPGAVLTSVRRAMAIEMLRYAREQSNAFGNTLTRADQVHAFAVQTMQVHDTRTKRHLQLPASALKVERGDHTTQVTLPWGVVLSFPTPPRAWNFMVLRDDDHGRWTIELSNSGYQLRRQDSAGFTSRGKGKKGGRNKRGDHRGMYSMPVDR